jgi:hypothetical protein
LVYMQKRIAGRGSFGNQTLRYKPVANNYAGQVFTPCAGTNYLLQMD